MKNIVGPIPESTQARFWQKVDQSAGQDACWLWTTAHTHVGYGRFALTHQRTVYAHRLAYFLTYGEIPTDKIVCHRCDNPTCCNPAHLFVGTHKENVQDMIDKGRKPRGENHWTFRSPNSVARGERQGSAKLSEEQVISLRTRYEAHDCERKELAAEFHIDVTHLWRIAKGRNWQHISQ